MDIEITVYDADSTVISHDIVPAQTATDAEINEMIALIEGGCPAHLAAQLVLNGRLCGQPLPVEVEKVDL